MTICCNRNIYPGDVSTPTASIELLKIFVNNVLSHHSAKFSCFDMNVFYLATSMDRSEYVKFEISDIPSGFMKDIIYKPSLIMDGYILKFSEGDMAYPKGAS